MKKCTSYQKKKNKKKQKGSSRSSGIKLINRKNTLPKRFKSKRELIDIQELKDAINETKNTLEHAGNRADHI